MTRVRPAELEDAAAIAAIWNEGIEERSATFETRPREPDEIAARIAAARGVLLVGDLDGEVVGWAGTSPYSDRPVYAGVAECSVYVARAARGRGIGRTLTEDLASAAEGAGLHKLLGKLFTTNAAALRLVRGSGFREVGMHRRHARLDGEWRDVLLVERLLGEAAEDGGTILVK